MTDSVRHYSMKVGIATQETGTETVVHAQHILHNQYLTVYTATGGYSDAQKEEILAILTKKEYGQFMDYVQAKDPNAFVTISNVKRVVGSWNTPKRRTYF